MKIKKIEQILKKAKRIILFEAEGLQWISDGQACYPIFDLPHLNQGSLFAMFDIPNDKKSNYIFEEREAPECISFMDFQKDETCVEMSNISIQYEGRILMPLPSALGVTFIDKKYLAPFADAEDGYQLYERIAEDGTPYIAVKGGLYLLGVILPQNVINENFVDKLSKIAKLSKFTLENIKLSGIRKKENIKRPLMYERLQKENE